MDQAPGKTATTAYARRISELIKATWLRSIEQSNDVPYGTVVVHLGVGPQGNAIDLHIVSGPPKEVLHRLALLAVENTQLPAMPEDAIKELRGNRFAPDLAFECVPAPTSNRKHSSR